MGIGNGVAACLAAASMVVSAPALADSSDEAEKLRRLDIMLMVTGLIHRKYSPMHFFRLTVVNRQVNTS